MSSQLINPPAQRATGQSTIGATVNLGFKPKTIIFYVSNYTGWIAYYTEATTGGLNNLNSKIALLGNGAGSTDQGSTIGIGVTASGFSTVWGVGTSVSAVDLTGTTIYYEAIS